MRRSRFAAFVLIAAFVSIAASLVLGSTRAGAELRVFVTNEKSDDVHVIGTPTVPVVKQIPVPKIRRGMRSTADSRKLLVASEQAHVVSVIDMDAMRVVKSEPTGGSRPVDIVRTPDGSRLYVSHG